MNPIDALRDAIAAVIGADDERAQRAATARPDAGRLAPTLPLVHRAPADHLDAIFAAGHLAAPAPCTAAEAQCGIPRAVYFFLGCVAYPAGVVAFLARPDVLARLPASFTPFDTGSLNGYARPLDTRLPWDADDRLSFLAGHLGKGPDTAAFAVDYLAGHFADVDDYVRRAQVSEPDDPPYHGLASTSGDRRAWTIEVQLHADLPVDAGHLQTIVLAQADLLADIPDDLVELLVIAENDELERSVRDEILGEEAA